jgi:DNA-binding PadR family transcriptional regulator
VAAAKPPIPLSYVILAAIGDHGATTTELVDMASRGDVFWTSQRSQVFAEPKRLLRLGWITAAKQPARTRNRTVYRLTEAGRQALTRWLRLPSRFPRLQHEAAIRMFAGDMIDDRDLLASLQAMHDDLDRLSDTVTLNIRRASRFPERERYLRLEQDLARRLIDAHRNWLALVERELAA